MTVTGKRLISGSSHAFPWGNWVSVLVLTGMGAGIYLANSPLPTAAQQNMLLVAVAVTGLIALGIFCQAALVTLRYFRYRGLQLELTPETAVTGSEFSGTLFVPIPFRVGCEFKVALSAAQLTAVSERDSDSDSNRYRTSSRPLHSDACSARAEASGPGTLLHFAFRLPADAQRSLGYAESVVWTDATAGRTYVKWQITISAEVPGIDLDETFEIPVVRPGASEMPLPAGHNPSFAMARTGSEVRITQAAWKKPGEPGAVGNMLGVGTLATMLVFGWEIGGTLGAWLFAAGAIPMAAIAAYFAQELAVTISPTQLRIVRRIGTYTLMDVGIERARIKAVEIVPSFGRHADSFPARTVRVRTREDQTYALAEFMIRTRDVLALCNLVAARLALGTQVIVGARELQQAQTVHVYEPWLKPGVKLVGRLLILGIAGWLSWPWFNAFYEANWGEKSAKAATVQTTAAPAAALPPVTAGTPSVDADVTSARWWTRFEHAMEVNSARRFDEAEKQLRRILSDVERESGAGHPFAGLLHYHLAMVHGNQQRKADREAELKLTLDIFERQPVNTVKAALGPMGSQIDRESVARDLGDLLWDLRRAADAYGYYEKAYAAAAELDTTEDVRNDRLALAAAGVMVTSCTLQKWDVAEKAMAEVKQRYPAASPGAQPRLKYWIDSGEPRLKARNCA
jgi:predicted negative regulator of RcsB-dependent stress response